MGTTVRTMVKVNATTDGDQHQDMVNVAAEVWERGGRRRVCGDEWLATRVVMTCAVMLYSSV